jgi:HAD superfamily hydrolase (TIGR01509 family)
MVDSEGTQLQAVNAVLAPYGIKLDRRFWIDRCVGHKTRHFLSEVLGQQIEPAAFEDLLLAKSAAYRDLCRSTPPAARPGIPELIAAAIQNGFRCGIASATPEADIREVTDRLGLSPLLQVIVSSDSVPRPKPAPDVYLRAAALLGVEPGRAVVVEDTPTGLVAGRAAGMHCVAFPNEWTAHLDFSAAEIVVHTLSPASIDRILALIS